MERVRVLIQKLQEQSGRGEDAASLLATTQALAAELESLLPRPAPAAGGRVAVVMPAGMRPVVAAEATPAPVPQVEPPAPPREEPPAIIEESPVIEPAPAPLAPQTFPGVEQPFDVVEDVPTLAQQTPLKATEPSAEAPSLNERLKRHEPELAARLTGTPIRDLRKGIGINDRFLFLSELFRGDETMYERSIKTINAFHILPEAEYWINRELKVKLGWDDNDATVQHFYNLVRRRFS
jgi:hypothetical protein